MVSSPTKPVAESPTPHTPFEPMEYNDLICAYLHAFKQLLQHCVSLPLSTYLRLAVFFISVLVIQYICVDVLNYV